MGAQAAETGNGNQEFYGPELPKESVAKKPETHGEIAAKTGAQGSRALDRIPQTLAATFGGTSLLIVVGVAMDTVAQIEAHLLTRSYDGFLGGKAGKFRGRRA